uniref:Fork-head domain-containing protein n=1 Tax=Xiphophorus couchianus TaxID=32473 RepID=A0A3B5LNW3_9TELE
MLMMEDDELDAHQVDPDFEPQSRPRSCTWPLPCPEDFPGGQEVSGGLPLASIKLKHPTGAPAPTVATHPCLAGAALDVTGSLRKAKSSRRNAWGNQSYADLITRAIESTPEKRLTLSQIYDWMVRYVPYFKDKGDSNSSAGWKNSIRHNLSLHTRFIRVQNEGTGKSSWWMLNPDGGKMGKAPRRRAVSMDNSTKYLKSKGRIRGKRVGRPGIGAGSAVGGLQSSPDHGSPSRKALPGPGVASGTDGEFDTWTDLHSRASSSASTLSGRLSPILAEVEPEEPEEGGLSCSASPHLYPSPTSARSPSMGAGNHCPPLEQLPQLHQTPVYHYNSGMKGQVSYGGGVYNTTGMGILRHHSPMQTIQENKATSFSGTMRAYSSTNALQSLLTGGSAVQQYSSKDLMLGQEREGHPMLGQASNGVGPNHHSHHPVNQLQTYNHKAPYLYSPPSHAHLPASTTLPPNPAGMLGMPQDSCHVASTPHPRHSHYPDSQHQGLTNGPYHHGQGMGNGSVGSSYHGYHQPYPHDRLPADLDIDMFHGSLDCDVESILLHDIMDSGEEMDFNFDCSLAQGVGIGMGMGMGQAHSNQSWVPG